MADSAPQWSFDISSFMVLLGESEEVKYRLMRRSFLECICAAPVAGVQSYLHSHYALIETIGMAYFSPYGCKTAPLRNMRLDNSVRVAELLRDGKCVVYKIPDSSDTKRNGERTAGSAMIVAWVAFSWLVFAGLMVFVAMIKSTSWIGFASCSVSTGWSVLVRLLDRYCLGLAKLSTSRGERPDAIFILGRRNSCFILDGSRFNIARWTGQGLAPGSGRFVRYAMAFTRIGTLAVITFIFATVPNGTTFDQIAFIILNVLGQGNVMLGQYLCASSCLAELDLAEEYIAPSRTHVYAFLLRKFGNGGWVDAADLLPKTQVWERWRKAVVDEPRSDPKILYEGLMDDGCTHEPKIDKDTANGELHRRCFYIFHCWR